MLIDDITRVLGPKKESWNALEREYKLYKYKLFSP